jgi:hypothetical protein
VGPPLSEKVTAGKRAGRARLAQELSGDLEDALEEDGEIGDETDPDDPEAEDAELAGLDNREDPDSPDLPDLEEILSAEHRGRRGGSVSQPRSASLLPPDLRPRVVERVIRDPRVAARVLARAAKNGHGLVDRGEEIFRNPPEANKGAWGHEQDQQQDWMERARDAQGAARALPGARGLELSDRQRRGLEGLLDRPLTSGADLVQAVAGLTTNSIAGIAISLTGAERDEVARRAAYNRRTPEQEFAAAWEMIKPLVFNAMRAVAGTVEISGKDR